MDTARGERASFNTPRDLKPILASPGPCLTVYMPLEDARTADLNPNARHNQLRWKECMRAVETSVERFGQAGHELVKSVSDWNAIVAEVEGQGKSHARSVVVFRSPEIFQVALLDMPVAERSTLGPHFVIRPLLAELVRDRSFYLLALSQKDTRLLRCTHHGSQQIPLGAGTQTNFDHWMNQAKPDHRAVDNAMTRSARGASVPTALAPKGADAEAKGEYLSHFFKQLDRGVVQTLKSETHPLVLCGVEYELALYLEVNSYPYVAGEAVYGAPNSLKAGEMHARALEALERTYFKKVDDALAEWNHRVGAGASSHLKEVVVAAHDGRVLNLLIAEGQESVGVFDEATNSVRARETDSAEQEDLINDAAVQTLLHAGNVLVAPRNKMPNGAPVAATFRY